MKTIFFGILIGILLCVTLAQEISGTELLEKAIAYHDPSDRWQKFDASFFVQLKTPSSPERMSEVTIDLPNEFFNLSVEKDSITTQYTLDKDDCSFTICSKGNVQPTASSSFKEKCDRARLYKNYYTYLYGLPMKLKDPGTQIDEKVIRKEFKGKEYLVLRVSYDEAVGKDVWFFYFNPKSYALEMYQFFKGDPEKEGKNTGEYILLSEEKIIQDIRMPKVRAWYYNKNDEYLGTDILK